MKIRELFEAIELTGEQVRKVSEEMIQDVLRIIKENTDLKKVGEGSNYPRFPYGAGGINLNHREEGKVKLSVVVYLEPDYAFVDLLKIPEEYQGKGLGKKIMEAVLKNLPDGFTVRYDDYNVPKEEGGQSFWEKLSERNPKLNWQRRH